MTQTHFVALRHRSLSPPDRHLVVLVKPDIKYLSFYASSYISVVIVLQKNEPSTSFSTSEYLTAVKHFNLVSFLNNIGFWNMFLAEIFLSKQEDADFALGRFEQKIFQKLRQKQSERRAAATFERQLLKVLFLFRPHAQTISFGQKENPK